MGTYYSPRIVTDGLVLCLDAANPKSYPGTGTTWKDLSGQGADAIVDVAMPTFVANGAQSYFEFDGSNDELKSVDMVQEYRDFFAIINFDSTAPSISMLFGKYDNQDDSIRFITSSGHLRPAGNADLNDWQYQNESDVFTNGVFDAASTDLRDRWAFIRSYRTNNTGFGSEFRYEISSSFGSRRYKGKLNMLFCYNRRLSDAEVLQNYNALRGRYGI